MLARMSQSKDWLKAEIRGTLEKGVIGGFGFRVGVIQGCKVVYWS